MTLVKPRAILFDWDNTLVDTWPLIHTAMNVTMRHMGQPEWSYERIRNEVKHSMRDSFPTLFGERWQEAGAHYQQSYRALHLEQLTPLPGVTAMLESIAPDIFLGVVSNKQAPTLRLELAHLGWQKYFKVAVGATDAPRDKPHPDPVLFALRDSGIAPAADVWFVGDTGADLGAAQATGCTPVLYGEQDVPETNGEYDGYPFAVHVRDHEALKALITANF
ncbi:MAG: HAD family hydrolase [Alphaproteobacteria bacterium]|nr:HAD family hydrolase [Alphaproteobacteria bacterium]